MNLYKGGKFRILYQIVERKVGTKRITGTTIFDPNGAPSLMEKTSLDSKNGTTNYYNFSVNTAGIATQETINNQTGKMTKIIRDLSSFASLFFKEIN